MPLTLSLLLDNKTLGFRFLWDAAELSSPFLISKYIITHIYIILGHNYTALYRWLLLQMQESQRAAPSVAKDTH